MLLAEARRKLLKVHPDRGGSHLAAIKAIRAYKKLKDPHKPKLSKLEEDFLEYIRRYPGVSGKYIARHLKIKPNVIGNIGNRLSRLKLAYLLVKYKRGQKRLFWYKGIEPRRLNASNETILLG